MMLILSRRCSFFFFSSRRRHTRYIGDWSSDVCSSNLVVGGDGDALGGGLTLDGYDSLAFPAIPTNAPLSGTFGSKWGNHVLLFVFDGPKKIGRASCRERVENWVVAVSWA